MNDFEFDPERALWKPNRRSFLFMLGAALVTPTLPENDLAGLSVIDPNAITLCYTPGSVGEKGLELIYSISGELLRVTEVSSHFFGVVRGPRL